MAYVANVDREDTRQAIIPRTKWKTTSNEAFVGSAIIVGRPDIRSGTVRISLRMYIITQQDTSPRLRAWQ